jgi:hypothetical protein
MIEVSLSYRFLLRGHGERVLELEPFIVDELSEYLFSATYAIYPILNWWFRHQTPANPPPFDDFPQ